MSTKNSIFLTEDNEHWYHEGLTDCFVLEFDKHHIIKKEENITGIIIYPNTPLYKELKKISHQQYILQSIKHLIEK
ncbi:MAG: hypothetical protein KKE05_04405 [Nanoarchaeota archaeon]|nr:hypothetical protein [Nanoarchaeota archaeon]